MGRRSREPETARIESVTHDGKGIAGVEGKKVFVAGALAGETVCFQRRKRKRNYDEAELIEVLEASEGRIKPRCVAFKTCGGCSLQHITGDDQRAIKHRSLVDSLQRIGKVQPLEWLDPIFDNRTDGDWNYRRRARLAVKDVAGKGRVLVGFRERHAPYVCDMHRCEVLASPVDGLIDPLSELIAGLSIRRRLPQVEVAVADNITELVFRVLDPPTEPDIVALQDFARHHQLQVAIQPGGPDSVQRVGGDDDFQPLSYRLPEFDVSLEFDATDFVQVNGRVNQLMVSRALQLLNIDGDHRVLDLYCGIGNFSLPMAKRSAHVLGIEGERHQVRRAEANARLNDIDNCEFRHSDLSGITGNEQWVRAHWDRVLLDPARSGAPDVVANMSNIGASRVVYISCHPGTLARDAGTLVREQGFTLETAGIIDMFPHTGHVESIAVFQKG